MHGDSKKCVENFSQSDLIEKVIFQTWFTHKLMKNPRKSVDNNNLETVEFTEVPCRPLISNVNIKSFWSVIKGTKIVAEIKRTES